MSLSSVYAILNVRRPLILTFQLSFPRYNYAKKETAGVSMVGGALKKKKLGKLGPMMEKKVLPVETDAAKLIGFVCGSNLLKVGQDVEIKEDSEYPQWLWNLRTGPAPHIDDIDPNSKQYWKRIKKLAIKRNNQLAQLKKF